MSDILRILQITSGDSGKAIQKAVQKPYTQPYEKQGLPYAKLYKMAQLPYDAIQKAVQYSRKAGLDKAIQEQIEKSNKLIEAKDEMITMINMQKVDLQRQNEELKAKVNELEKQSISVVAATSNPADRKDAEIQIEKKLSEEENIENKIEVRREEIQLEERKKSIGKRIRNYLFPSTDTKKFIGKYLENDKMTKEQKDYLLECLESGVGIKEMSEFAFENLTVEQMERLRKINEKRKE